MKCPICETESKVLEKVAQAGGNPFDGNWCALCAMAILREHARLKRVARGAKKAGWQIIKGGAGDVVQCPHSAK